MKKQLLIILTLFATSISVLAQNVNIPDANFKAYLVGNASINTNADAEIQVSEASAFTGTINCQTMSISDLTGIASFSALNQLNCSGNQLSVLNVTQNTALERLYCQNNTIGVLDVSQNVLLQRLYCSENNLLSLDVSQNTDLKILSCTNNMLSTVSVVHNLALEELFCGNNSMTTLDVSQNTDLQELTCSANLLSALDVSHNPILGRLYCTDNYLDSLNLHQNYAMVWLYCTNNSISALDLSNNYALERLYCNGNSINALDISQNTSVSRVFCQDNNLSSLNVANGNNTNFVFFNSSNNPSLTCIQVDDSTYSSNNWTAIDSIASFSLFCGPVLVTSITVQGQGGVNEITIDDGTLQMEGTLLPANASDQTYTWSVTNGTGSAIIDGSGLLTALTNGTVTVVATANDGSGVSGDAIITVSNQTTVGIDIYAFKNLNIYPNPVTDVLNIALDENVTSLKLIDLTGKAVKVYNSNQKQLDLSSISTGIYFLEVANNNKKSIIKILKK